jgi:hypothetical protein
MVGILRPLLKGAIKGGMQLYENGKVVAAELGEAAEDLMAEVHVEMEEAAPAAAAVAAAPVKRAQPKARATKARVKKAAAAG